MSTAVLPEPPSVVDPRLADLLEDMREARWLVEDIASDIHHQADLLMRSFPQLERSIRHVAQRRHNQRLE